MEELLEVITNVNKKSGSPVLSTKNNVCLPDPGVPKKKKTQQKNKKQPKPKPKPSPPSTSSISDLSSISRGSSSHDPGEDDDVSLSSVSSTVVEDDHFMVQKRKQELMQEKIEMLTRISRLSHEGFTTTKKWSTKDDIDDIRFECYRMTRESNTRKSLKSMQHILITLATVIEFANSVVNPFNLRLEGFSRNLMLTVSDYDDSLEQLHHKWSDRTSLGPEANILFTFVSSAIFHHAGNVMSSKTNNNNNNSESSQSQYSSSSSSSSPPPHSANVSNMTSMMSVLSKLISPPASSSTPTQKTGTGASVRRPMQGPKLAPSITIPKNTSTTNSLVP